MQDGQEIMGDGQKGKTISETHSALALGWASLGLSSQQVMHALMYL